MKGRRKHDPACISPSRVTAKLLLSFLALSAPVQAFNPAPINAPIPISPLLPDTQQHGQHEFTLRHIFHHGTYRDPGLHKRLDVHPQSSMWTSSSAEALQQESFSARSNGIDIQRLSDRRVSSINTYLSHAGLTGEVVSLAANDWTVDEVNGPDVTDKDTVLNLARMAADTYDKEPGEGEWLEPDDGFNHSQGFGWEGDGLRGHIFADECNRTIVMAIKGTSPAVFDGDETTTKDKLNDNLFGSCCCAQGGQYFWRQVCDCYSTTYTCNQTCLVKSLKSRNRYYQAAIELYTNVTELYPDSNVWLTGHSLGGVVSSLLGLTFGLPTTTFEAYGDALAAGRLGLPAPPGSDPSKPQNRKLTGIHHFGHTADPVFMGTCNGATASCTLGGYAFESQCHTGLQCVYDTVGDLGWRVGIGNHKIRIVISDVLSKYDHPPKCVPDDECYDCFNWKYFESNGSDSTTKSSTSHSSTRTRTTTCKTPGWWGCLDESTTTSTTSSALTTSTTTTCETPGWFGCKDTTTTTFDVGTPTPAPSATRTAKSPHTTAASTSCQHPGFFGGCNDKTFSTSAHITSTTPSSTHSCESPGLFFGCRDHKHTSPSTTTAVPSLSSSVPTRNPSRTHKSHQCTSKAWFGLICLDPSRTTAEGTSVAQAGKAWKSEI